MRLTLVAWICLATAGLLFTWAILMPGRAGLQSTIEVPVVATDDGSAALLSGTQVARIGTEIAGLRLLVVTIVPTPKSTKRPHTPTSTPIPHCDAIESGLCVQHTPTPTRTPAPARTPLPTPGGCATPDDDGRLPRLCVKE